MSAVCESLSEGIGAIVNVCSTLPISELSNVAEQNIEVCPNNSINFLTTLSLMSSLGQYRDWETDRKSVV